MPKNPKVLKTLLQVVAYGSRRETVRILRGSLYSNSMHA